MNNKKIVRHCVELARIANHMALGARRLGIKSKASLYSDRAKRHMAAAREWRALGASTASNRVADPKVYAARKFQYALRRAEEASHNARFEPACDRAEYKRLRREAMQDARYWLGKMRHA